jgi:hypothetical protein
MIARLFTLRTETLLFFGLDLWSHSAMFHSVFLFLILFPSLIEDPAWSIHLFISIL